LLNPDTWLQQVSVTSPIGFMLVAAAGLVMGMAPSSLPLASVVAGYVGGQARQPDTSGWQKELWLSTGFILGLATVDTAIGVLFGFLGTTAIRLVAGSLAVTKPLPCRAAGRARLGAVAQDPHCPAGAAAGSEPGRYL
jgi:cytochrome c biogenesis protein CcdA